MPGHVLRAAATAHEPRTRAASAPGRQPRRHGGGAEEPAPVPVGVTGHRTQRPRGQVGPPGPHPAQPSSTLDPRGERGPIIRPLAPLIAQLIATSCNNSNSNNQPTNQPTNQPPPATSRTTTNSYQQAQAPITDHRAPRNCNSSTEATHNTQCDQQYQQKQQHTASNQQSASSSYPLGLI
jgi:hypothetical protein